ncbi:MAG: type II toxin-antitoxin system RelE family toxin [Methanosarcinales archaeon]
MSQIELSEKFKNQIKKIKDETVRDRVRKELKNLLKDPDTGKPLRYSFKGFRSIRIGKYRLLYAIDGDVIRVYAFEHRKDVYR